MAILEEVAANILFFEKMSPTYKEKQTMAVEAHYKLYKSKGKSHTFNTYKNGGVNRAKIWAAHCQNSLCFVKAPKGTPELHCQNDGRTTPKTQESSVWGAYHCPIM